VISAPSCVGPRPAIEAADAEGVFELRWGRAEVPVLTKAPERVDRNDTHSNRSPASLDMGGLADRVPPDDHAIPFAGRRRVELRNGTRDYLG
jgi:hypothetical protein